MGSGDNSRVTFYLDYAFVVDGSVEILSGTAESNASALTPTTHYFVNNDDGILTLTGTGTTSVGTNTLYAKYSYSLIGITSSQAQEALDRAQADVDEQTSTHWADGGTSTPDYTKIINEVVDGKGKYDRDYYTLRFPLPNFYTRTAGTVNAGSAKILVSDTDGFPSSGYVAINDQKVYYESKTGTSFNAGTGMTEAQAGSSIVTPWVVEISTTDSGTEPTFTVQKLNEDYDLDNDSGRIHLYRTDYDPTYFALQYPPRLVPNRFRVSYLYGNDSIPGDIKRVTLMIAAKDLMHSVYRHKVVGGQSAANSEIINIDDAWIEKILDEHRNPSTRNI